MGNDADTERLRASLEAENRQLKALIAELGLASFFTQAGTRCWFSDELTEHGDQE